MKLALATFVACMCVCGWDKEIAVHHESSRLSFVEFGCEYFWLCRRRRRRRCGSGFLLLLLPRLVLFTTRIHYSLLAQTRIHLLAFFI